MYAWLRSWLPGWLVNLLCCIWYTALLTAIVLQWDLPFGGFYYLGG